MILAQRKIFNIFPGSVQDSSIVKILSSFLAGINIIIYRAENFGLINYILTSQTPAKNNV